MRRLHGRKSLGGLIEIVLCKRIEGKSTGGEFINLDF